MRWFALVLSGIVGAQLIAGAGCESTPNEIGIARVEERLPMEAIRVGERRTFKNRQGRTDEGLYFQTQEDGTIYVVNTTSGRVIYSGPIEEDEKFWLNLDWERAMQDGRLVYEGNLPKGQGYQLYFVPRP